MNITYLKCNHCKDSIFSFSRHSMVYCKCGKIAIDGGFDYTKITGNKEDFVQLTSPVSGCIKLIREKFQWIKRYNKQNQLLKIPQKRKLKDLTTDHIIGILLYFTNQLSLHDDGNSCNMSNQWLIEELKYRKLK